MAAILCIVGTTATGKTKLACDVFSRLTKEGKKGVLLSADSKQVYRFQDIVTGKDHPSDVELLGVDLVSPNEEWSVSHFVEYGNAVIKRCEQEKALLIIVGGTGMYVESLLHPPASIDVPRNELLRSELEVLSVDELQQRLVKLDQPRFESMNHSDQLNPRRLIRAIEIAISGMKLPVVEVPMHQITWVGLQLSLQELEQRIRSRVQERLEAGAIEETKYLLKAYPDWRPEASSSLGYSEIQQHLKGEITREQLIELWVHDELSYAKRQVVWFAKNKEIEWFDPSTVSHLETKVVDRALACYNRAYEQ